MHPQTAARRAPALASLVLALGAAGCQVVEASAHNLDALHEEDGRHRYSAALESDFQYFWRTFAERILRRSPLKQPAPEAIENPAKECLAELLDLTAKPAAHPTTRALQISWSAHLALVCPWRLSRERALIELGEAGELLELRAARDLEPEQVPAGPAVIGEAIEGLTRAVRATRSGGARSPEARRADLIAACEAARDLVLDVESGRRVLRAASELVRVTGLSGADARVLLELVEELEKRIVSIALARAQEDADPFVRAAAIRAAVRVGGKAQLAPWLERCAREDARVAREVLALVREHGLPASADEGESHERQLSALYAQLYRPEPGVRVRAMEALASLGETPKLGLREEEWQAWWIARTGSARPLELREGVPDASAAPRPGAGAAPHGGAR